MKVLSTRRAVIRRGLTTAVAGGLLASGAVIGTYASAEAASVAITAHPSKDSVSSGEQFRVRGLFTINGSPAVDKVVKIQSRTSDGWTNLSGARVSTGDDGRYSVRVVLSMKGERVLRAVGITPSPNVPNPTKRFTVTVS